MIREIIEKRFVSHEKIHDGLPSYGSRNIINLDLGKFQEPISALKPWRQAA